MCYQRPLRYADLFLTLRLSCYTLSKHIFKYPHAYYPYAVKVMNKNLIYALLITHCLLNKTAIASDSDTLYFPVLGVVCDKYFCANSREGVSLDLTKHYLGKKASERLASQGTFEHGSFTFSNGVYCDIRKRACYKDRFFDADGNPSACVEVTISQKLFPERRDFIE